MTLALHYNASKDGAESLRSEIEGQGGRAACFPADLGNADAARALAGRVADELGQLDVLVNSAAVMHHVSFEDTTPELFDEVLHLNLRSVFFVSQGAAPFLRKAGGKIVNLADLGGLEPWPGYAAHSVSKAGVVMLTRILARSLAPEVTVNAIAPGAVLVPERLFRRRAHPARRNDAPQAARDTRTTRSRHCSTCWSTPTSSPATSWWWTGGGS